ncbi:MAG: NUDIX domain-containing protein [Proteobacteria bacterium]|nr:NUDIX domain-containing protein [Pseudomonadota bacterium]MCH8953044.1 NUDIX domain-containing protein [Pseudomonadota bacterium]
MYFFTAHFLSSLACVPLFALAILRYIGQRFKSTEQAYRFIITLTAQPQIAEPTHAGGVVYRQETGTTTYLVTQARRNRDHWVLPKGHIEPCEDSRDTAVREVREETGFRVRVIRGLYDCRLGKGPESPLVRFYLMELIEGHWQEPDEGRESVWLEAADAIERLTAAESKGLLAYAEHLCRATPDR